MGPRSDAAGDPGRVSSSDYNPPVRRVGPPGSLHRSRALVSRTSRSLATVAAIALIVVGVATAAFGWWLLQPLPLPVSPFAFDVKPGATLKSVARDLVGAGVLRHEFPLVALARIAKADRSIKAGNYEIVAGITL